MISQVKPHFAQEINSFYKISDIISNSKYIQNNKFVKQLYVNETIKPIPINEFNMIEKYIKYRDILDNNNFHLSNRSQEVFEDFFNFCIDNNINLINSDSSTDEYYVGLNFDNIQKIIGNKILHNVSSYGHAQIFNNFVSIKQANDNIIFRCKSKLYRNKFKSALFINHSLDNQTTEYYVRTGGNNGIKITLRGDNNLCCEYSDEVFDIVSGMMIKQQKIKNQPSDDCINFICDASQNILKRNVTESECCNLSTTEVFENGKMVKKNIKKNPAPPQCVNFTCDVSKNISRNVNTATDCIYGPRIQIGIPNCENLKGGNIRSKTTTQYVSNLINTNISVCPTKQNSTTVVNNAANQCPK
jgi:hypothetical protein